jgi:hypothetical protein
MSSSADSSIIEEKKTKDDDNKTTFINNVVKFLTNIVILLIVFLIYFSTSSVILNACKLAQSNIMPTEGGCYPYVSGQKPTIQEITTNIFTTGEMSMKLKFPFDEYNSSNKIIDLMREYKEKPTSHFIVNYFIEILESLMQFNYNVSNTMFNLLNENFSETLLVFIGPILMSFAYSIITLLNYLYFIYLWFANFKWFFMKNVNADANTEERPKWESVSFIEPLNIGIGLLLSFVFLIAFFVGLPVLSVFPMVALGWSIFSLLFYKSELNGEKSTLIDVLRGTFIHYKTSIMILLSIFIVNLAFSNLGMVSGIFSLAILLLINIGIISIDIFKEAPVSGLSKLVGFKQAKKSCPAIFKNREKHGFLYNMLLGQKGGNTNSVIQQIKKLNK